MKFYAPDYQTLLVTNSDQTGYDRSPISDDQILSASADWWRLKEFLRIIFMFVIMIL
jgi:hypothetical protein